MLDFAGSLSFRLARDLQVAMRFVLGLIMRQTGVTCHGRLKGHWIWLCWMLCVCETRPKCQIFILIPKYYPSSKWKIVFNTVQKSVKKLKHVDGWC